MSRQARERRREVGSAERQGLDDLCLEPSPVSRATCEEEVPQLEVGYIGNAGEGGRRASPMSPSMLRMIFSGSHARRMYV